MKIYTKKGDEGQTYLSDGMMVSKDDPRIEVIGELDELNCYLGCLTSLLSEKSDKDNIYRLQKTIFSISSNLLNVSFSLNDELHFLENEIDNFSSIIPPQHSFLLPGGCTVASQAHVCRVFCRRVERHAFALSKQYPVNTDILKYLNRLSDYFYVLARKINFENRIEEKTWQNTCR